MKCNYHWTVVILFINPLSPLLAQSPLETYLTAVRQNQHPSAPPHNSGKPPHNITLPSPPCNPTTPTPSRRYEPKPTT